MDQPRASNFEFRRTEIWRKNRHLLFGCLAAVALMATVASVLNMPGQLSWMVATLTAALVAVTGIESSGR